jgi:adenylate cyclase
MRITFEDPSGKKEELVTDAAVVLIGRGLAPGPGRLGLKDVKVSSQHARLSVENGECWIEDLDSTNGTWVGKAKIKTRTRVGAGVVIRVGQTSICVEDLPPPTKPVLPACPASEPGAGKPDEVVEAGQSLPDLLLAGADLEAARFRLSAAYDLLESMGEIDHLEGMATALLDHLLRAFPRAGRGGHSGLLLGENLILRAFRPEDEPPTCSLSLARQVSAEKRGCLWRIDESAGDSSASLLQAGIRSAMYAPLVYKGEVLGVLYLDASSPKAMFDKDDLRLMQIMATQAAMSIKNLYLQQTMQRESIVKARLLAQFPKTIAERLAKQPGRLAVLSERVDAVTVLFSDVRGFTKMASTMDPDRVVQMLNDMFHDLTPLVLKANGTVDKYIGDAVLAVFGSPDPDDRQWEHAVQAALEMQEAMNRLTESRWQGRPPFRIGIGIHTGPVIHGFIGAPERQEYTVIGNTINVASRYCSGAGPGEILISPATYARVHQIVDVDHPPREIETKHEDKLKAYAVRGWKGKAPA